jgi:transposase, IS5 family
MLRDRYEPVDLFALIHVEGLGMKTDPVLMELDRLLEEASLFQLVKADLAKRYPRTLIDGRHSTPVEVILRMLLVKHLYQWSFEQTEYFVADSLVLRQFCRVYHHKVPDDTVLIRWTQLIRPETMHRMVEEVVRLARRKKITRGRKLRVDGTVVETHIHPPQDSTLLWDSVRVLSRKLKQAQTVVTGAVEVSRTLFRDRTRSAKRTVHRLLEAARQRGEKAQQAMRGAYTRLVEITEATLKQARQVATVLTQLSTKKAQKLREEVEGLLPLVEQALDQTRRRVFQGEQLRAEEKLLSLFEPHSAVIRRGKASKAVEFGRKVWLDEVEGGLVTRYEILPGNAGDALQMKPSLQHHLRLFGKPPKLLAGDRGVHSEANERYARRKGVQQVVLPKPGAKTKRRKAKEKQPWFRRGMRWRAGIEGRISVLQRRYGLDRCLYHGEEGMERWIGWGILAHDLRLMARALAA